MKSVYNEAGITEYDTYDLMVKGERYMRSTNQMVGKCAYVKETGTFYEFKNDQFNLLKVIDLK